MKNSVRLPQMVWYNGKDLEVNLPQTWNMKVCDMAGEKRKVLAPSEIKAAVKNPIGSPSIRTLAKGKKQVVIIFDDVQRPTRASKIIPFILEELAEAGIPDNAVRFIGATGCHGAMNRLDYANKLGEDIVRRFPVYSHNAFGNCVKIGTTKFGTDIFANAEVMSCDLKIAIGSILPHPAAGFGGGDKIVLPGVCAFETNQSFHQFGFAYNKEHPETPKGKGITKDNPLRMNMAEASKMVGLDIKIDTLINSRAEIVAVYVGKPDACFEAATKDARTHYITPVVADCDIVIANTFSKVGEFESGLEIAFASLKKEGGDIVAICNNPAGHVAHYLFGSWGNAKRPGQIEHGFPPNVKRLFVLNEYPDMSVLAHMGSREKVSLMTKWEDILEILKKSYPGSAQVAVYPGADIQYFEKRMD
jgi:lactate racemase